ncbi:hypothetical protein WN943_019307 [Citrus x changshan-huyou]
MSRRQTTKQQPTDQRCNRMNQQLVDQICNRANQQPAVTDATVQSQAIAATTTRQCNLLDLDRCRLLPLASPVSITAAT